LACWRIANDKSGPPSLEHSLVKTAQTPETFCVSNGMYVVVRIAKNRYIAMVTDVYNEEAEVDVSLLMPKLPAKDFHWPKEVKSATIPLPHVLSAVTMAETGEKVLFTENDLQKMYNLRILRKPK